ncbi:hypothetical protein Trydic_g8669 [Trypoxylus dichotomus]
MIDKDPKCTYQPIDESFGIESAIISINITGSTSYRNRGHSLSFSPSAFHDDPIDFGSAKGFPYQPDAAEDYHRSDGGTSSLMTIPMRYSISSDRLPRELFAFSPLTVFRILAHLFNCRKPSLRWYQLTIFIRESIIRL